MEERRVDAPRVTPDPEEFRATQRAVVLSTWDDFLLGAAAELTGKTAGRILELALGELLRDTERAIEQAGGVEGLEAAWRRYLDTHKTRRRIRR